MPPVLTTVRTIRRRSGLVRATPSHNSYKSIVFCTVYSYHGGMKIITALLFSALLISACSNPVPELKSPCVGAKGSPCEHRSPSNQFRA